jgi:hypothetical protein
MLFDSYLTKNAIILVLSGLMSYTLIHGMMDHKGKIFKLMEIVPIAESIERVKVLGFYSMRGMIVMYSESWMHNIVLRPPSLILFGGWPMVGHNLSVRRTQVSLVVLFQID